MHDADRDALPLSLNGADGTTNNGILVVATLTALLLAGSAIVYRTRPFLHTPVSNTAGPEKESGASSQDRELDLKSKRKPAGLSATGILAGEGGGDAQGENAGPTPPALSTKPVLDLETKDSKSSRSKDRRRRGKDPLKEILKGGKKSKLLTPAPSKGTSSTPTKTSQYDYNNDPENDNEAADDDDLADYEHHASPASSSASLLPDSASHSLSRAKGKRAQRNASIDLTGSTHFSSGAGSTSASHSRATSNSEVSQKQSQRQGGPSSQHSDQFHPLRTDAQLDHHAHHPHDRPPSSHLASLSAAEENNGRPHSPVSSSSSLSHPHTNTHQPNVPTNEKDIDAGLGSHLRTHSAVPGLDDNDQAHRVDLAPGSDDRVEDASQEGEGEGHSGKSVWLRDSSTSPSTVTTTTTTTTTTRLVDADGFSKPKSKSKSKASTSSASSSVSMDTTATDSTNTTTTGTTSMASSLVMTRATSPSLSDSSKKTPTLATTPGANDNDTPAPPLATGAKAKNARKTQSGNTTSPKRGDNKPSNPWNWDGVDASTSSALDAAAANIIASVTGVETNSNSTSKEKELKGKESESYKKPPRLQGAKGATTFSAVAASGLPSAASHPASLYSPTNANFSGLPGSVSFSAASPLLASAPTGAGENEGLTSEEMSTGEREEEEEAFTFPTLNPTTTTSSSSAGSSRTRSSLADINNNSNNFNNNTPQQLNNTRRARPPTPSRSNLSSASHTPPPPSSSSPSSQPGSISSSSGSVPNPNTNANGGGGVLLSTQTQLASLRGALEAARLREEKHKTEMDRVVKEVDVLRWEHANSRRGEIELQTHVRQLMQQLQTYASLFASMAPQLNAQYQHYYLQQQQQLQQAQQQLANGSSSATPGAAVTTAESGNSDVDVSVTLDGNAESSSSSTNQESTSTSYSATPVQPLQGQTQTPTQQPSNAPPPPLHIPATFPAFQANGANGVASPVGVLSSPSLGVTTYPGSPPFFPYSMSMSPHPHAPPTPHTHPLLFAQQLQIMQQHQHQYQQQQLSATQGQGQGQSQGQSQTQASLNLFSMHFPPGPHPHPPTSMMSPHQHHQVYATHGVPFGMGMGMGSAPSSVAGTSSAGSMSPDLGGSPSPNVNGNGKRRARTRTQTQNGRRGAAPASVGVWEERTVGGETWLNNGVEDNVIEEEPEREGVDGILDGSLRRVNGHALAGGDEEGEEEGFGEGGFNELLADAILKRPGSIRVRSVSKKDRLAEVVGLGSEKGTSPTKDVNGASEREEEVEQMTEFTFPSLVDHGHIHYSSDRRKVNGDCAPVFGTSPEATALELVEGDKAGLVLPSLAEGLDRSPVEPGVDITPEESQDPAVESESSPDLEITHSKEGMDPNPTESISHSPPTTTLLALKGTNVETLSSDQ